MNTTQDIKTRGPVSDRNALRSAATVFACIMGGILVVTIYDQKVGAILAGLFVLGMTIGIGLALLGSTIK